MNALQSYSSDDESGNEAPMHKSGKSGDPGTNYDDVGMDISEDSDDEVRSNTKEKSSAQPATDTNHPSGVPQHGTSLSTSATDGQKNQNETKEGQRSSLQERLLGIASGGRRLSQDDRGGSANRRESRTSPSRNRADHNHKKSKSKSPKAKSPRPRSPGGGTKNSHKTRSRSKSREREVGRSGQNRSDHSSRGHSGREQSSQGHSGRNRDGRDSRRSRDEERKRSHEERRSRRSRSRSRSRERRRSRSRSRDRRSRSRSRERRRRSHSHERKRPMDIRKAEAQQKLAALKAANPDLTAAELMRRSMEAQMEEVKKQTGITLPSYYNPATMNPMKFAEQERKKKLLWGNKSKPAGEGNTLGGGIATPGGSSLYGSLATVERPPAPGGILSNTGFGTTGLGRGLGLGIGGGGGIGRGHHGGGMGGGGMGGHGVGGHGVGGHGVGGHGVGGHGVGGGVAGSGGQASLWASTKFVNDKDGKMAEKFRRLMGVKGAGGGPGNESGGSSTSTTQAPPPPTTNNKGVDLLQKQETMFSSMERQYEMARLATHTHKGFGLGFTSQSFMPK